MGKLLQNFPFFVAAYFGNAKVSRKNN